MDRSRGDSDYVLSRTRTITVPQANGLAIGLVIAGVVGLVIAGVVGLGLTRRR